MDTDKLHDHLVATYFTLRIGMASTSLVFPVLLWGGGLAFSLELQDSMSAYYHAGDGAMRDWFVGILFAVGASLIVYRGASNTENWILNFAGLFAVGIAIIPMEWNCGDQCASFSLHGTFAILFFLCIAYICIFCAKESLPDLHDESARKHFSRLYNILGIGMMASPLGALVLSYLTMNPGAIIFFIEAAGVWVFAVYWLVKSRELSLSHAASHV